MGFDDEVVFRAARASSEYSMIVMKMQGQHRTRRERGREMERDERKERGRRIEKG